MEHALHVVFLGGGSEGETMTLTDESTEFCTFGAGGERLQYRMHFQTEVHNTPMAEVSRQAWFRLKSLSMVEGQRRFRDLYPHCGDG